MAGERRLPGNGLWGFWTLGTGGWKEGMDENWLRLSVLVQGSVLSRTAAVPANPADGSIYVVPATASENPHRIAVRDNGAWVYLDPRAGVRLYVQDTKEFAVFDGEKWAADETGGGFASFLELNDTPEDYGAPGQIVVVGPSGNRLVFADAPSGGGTGGGITEAPNDGKLYGRQNEAWSEITGGGGEGGNIELYTDFRVVWTALNDNSYAGLAEILFDGVRPTGGTAYASTSFSGEYPASAAFDNNPATYWSSAQGGATNAHLGYRPAAPRPALSSISLKAPNHATYRHYAPSAFRVEARKEDGTVAVLGTFNAGLWQAGETKDFALAAAEPVVGEGVNRIVALTQAQYDALSPKSAKTLYAIKGSSTVKLYLGTLPLAV